MSILRPADGKDADYATVSVSNDDQTDMTGPQRLSAEESKQQQHQQEGNQSPARDPKVKKLCGVCKANEAKYKCTRCFLPYCSVSCSTTHKASHPATESPVVTAAPNGQSTPQLNSSQPEKRKNIEPPTSSRPRGPFAALEESEELQELFRIYPSLPSQLEAIYSATLPPTSPNDINNNNNNSNNATTGPNTQLNFRNWPPGGKRSGKGKNQPWNQDVGLQSGVQALCRAREVFGKDGEAVREYSKLVLRILADNEEGGDATEQIQKELAEENARIISQLLNGEM